MEKEMICTLERNGFCGYFFPGTKELDKAIISVGASSCDEKTSIAMAGYLRKAGYNVLVLGYYHWKGLTKHLCQIPLDYVQKAICWLKEEQGVRAIAMTGVSEGASYALSCAERFLEITCVISVVPYDYVMEGMAGMTKRLHTSAFSYQGKPLPYTEMDVLDQGLFACMRQAKKDGYGFSRMLRWVYDDQEKRLHPDSRIQVEKMNADVLLLGVKDDDCWPSDIAVERMEEILKENHYPHRFEAYVYEKASHALMDGLASMSWLDRYELKHMFASEKNYPQECEEARADSFRRILAFLEAWTRK